MGGRDDAPGVRPIELLERLAAPTPRPRINLVLYYGVLGARAAWRSRLGAPDIPARARDVAGQDGDAEPRAAPTSAERPRSNRQWAELMQRSFGFDAGVPAARAVRGGVEVCWRVRGAGGVCA